MTGATRAGDRRQPEYIVDARDTAILIGLLLNTVWPRAIRARAGL